MDYPFFSNEFVDFSKSIWVKKILFIYFMSSAGPYYKTIIYFNMVNKFVALYLKHVTLI